LFCLQVYLLCYLFNILVTEFNLNIRLVIIKVWILNLSCCFLLNKLIIVLYILLINFIWIFYFFIHLVIQIYYIFVWIFYHKLIKVTQTIYFIEYFKISDASDQLYYIHFFLYLHITYFKKSVQFIISSLAPYFKNFTCLKIQKHFRFLKPSKFYILMLFNV